MSLVQKVTAVVVKALPDRPVDPLLEAHGAIGQPMSRVDGSVKVAGAARFVAEVPFEHLAFASLVYATIPKGRVTHIDADAARAARGVVLVMTHENAPRMAPPPLLALGSEGAAFSNLPVMQDDRVYWDGQPVAVVVADAQEQADHAASLVGVAYAPEPAALSFDAVRPTAKPPKDLFGQPAFVSKGVTSQTADKGGNAERALADAEVRVDHVYRTPFHSHSAIELHVTAAHWQPDGSLLVHDPSQALHATRYSLAESFGIKEERVRVIGQFVGGSFGSKFLWGHQLLCIAAAKLAGRPVRLVLSREGVARATGGRTRTEQRVALGARRDGTLTALVHTGLSAIVTHNSCPEQFSFPARHLYAADTMHIGQETVYLDMVANSSMRAPGESVGSFALESAVDELAEALAVDPVELRRRIEPERDPTEDTPFSSRHMVAAYARGAARFGWADRNRVPGGRRQGEWLVGHGVASAFYPYLRYPGLSARIRLTGDGHAVVQTAMHEMGMGTATVQIQHAAERLGLPVDRVRFEYGDTALPKGTPSGGSAQTVTIIAAVAAAQVKLAKALLKLAGRDSPLAGAKPDDVRARDGGLFRVDEPARGERYEALLARAGRDHVEVEAEGPPPLEMMKYAMCSSGAQFCEVRVHAVTGEIRVARWVGSFDVGRVINPKTAASQLRGGIIMGIGAALMEESLFDERTGRFMNPSLAEYHVPVHADVPPIDVLWTDIPDPHAPLGGRGVGEIGITGAAAAIANAVYNATGRRVRSLPITVADMLDATAGLP